MLRVRSFFAITALLFVAFVAMAPMASAQTDDSQYPLTTTPPTVLGTDFQKGDPPAVDPQAASQAPQVLAAGAGQSLPVTGSDIVGLTVLGLVAVGAGFALVRYQRSAADRI